jgi:rhodanese-related sulfurtransferase
MTRKLPLTIAAMVAIAVITLVVLLPEAQADNKSLDAIHDKIELRYPDVSHIEREGLSTLPADTLYFDVREPDEYAVSHIPGAVQVSPDISPDAFMARFGDEIEGKTAVFYCSVGRRSSRLIDRLDHVLEEEQTTAYNLEGSIFRWHNDEAPLVNDAGATEKVHPYNWLWSRHLERKNQTSYKP